MYEARCKAFEAPIKPELRSKTKSLVWLVRVTVSEFTFLEALILSLTDTEAGIGKANAHIKTMDGVKYVQSDGAVVHLSDSIDETLYGFITKLLAGEDF